MTTHHTKKVHLTRSHGVLCMEHAWPQGTKKNFTSIRATRTLAPRVSRACFHLPAVPGYLQKPGVQPHAQHTMIAMMMTMSTGLPCSCWASVSSCDPLPLDSRQVQRVGFLPHKSPSQPNVWHRPLSPPVSSQLPSCHSLVYAAAGSGCCP